MFVFRRGEEIGRWHLAFHIKEGKHWTERLVPGRFSHVSAFAWVEGPRVWVLIDHTPRGPARVVIWPEEAQAYQMPPGLAYWTTNCSILVTNVRPREGFRVTLGFWCITAVKDLVGLKSRALFPEALWRDLIREGSTIVYDAKRHQAAARPGPDRTGSAGAGPAATGGPVQP